jgi:hypothetical protein
MYDKFSVYRNIEKQASSSLGRINQALAGTNFTRPK